jgi:hypothetical protein
MEDPSTIRRAEADIGGAPYGGDSLAGQTGGGVENRAMISLWNLVPHLFYVRNMFFCDAGYWPVSERSGLILIWHIRADTKCPANSGFPYSEGYGLRRASQHPRRLAE